MSYGNPWANPWAPEITSREMRGPKRGPLSAAKPGPVRGLRGPQAWAPGNPRGPEIVAWKGKSRGPAWSRGNRINLRNRIIEIEMRGPGKTDCERNL